METTTFSLHEHASSPIDVLDVIVFAVGDQEFGIDVARVEELRGHDAIVPAMQAPRFVSGIINLRGVPVPLIDMQVLLGFAPVDYERISDIIVVGTGGRLTALGVSDIVGVEKLMAGQISPPPVSGALLHADLLIGIGHVAGNRTLTLIDIDNLLGDSWLRSPFMMQ